MPKNNWNQNWFENQFLEACWLDGAVNVCYFFFFRNLGQADGCDQGMEELCGHESGCPVQLWLNTSHSGGVQTEYFTLWQSTD